MEPQSSHQEKDHINLEQSSNSADASKYQTCVNDQFKVMLSPKDSPKDLSKNSSKDSSRRSSRLQAMDKISVKDLLSYSSLGKWIKETESKIKKSFSSHLNESICDEVTSTKMKKFIPKKRKRTSLTNMIPSKYIPSKDIGVEALSLDVRKKSNIHSESHSESHLESHSGITIPTTLPSKSSQLNDNLQKTNNFDPRDTFTLRSYPISNLNASSPIVTELDYARQNAFDRVLLNWPHHIVKYLCSRFPYENLMEIEFVPSDHFLFDIKINDSQQRRVIWRGLRKIPKGSCLGEYRGLYCDIPTVNYSGYSWKVSSKACVDGMNQGSYLRFVNHYENICNHPNTKSVVLKEKQGSTTTERVYFFTVRDIYPNEEILVDYGIKSSGGKRDCLQYEESNS